jgi:hypothetical protein
MPQSLLKQLANRFRYADIRSLAGRASRRLCPHPPPRTTVAEVLVAWDQQESVEVPVGQHSEAGNFSPVIDRSWPYQRHISAANQGI